MPRTLNERGSSPWHYLLFADQLIAELQHLQKLLWAEHCAAEPHFIHTANSERTSLITSTSPLEMPKMKLWLLPLSIRKSSLIVWAQESSEFLPGLLSFTHSSTSEPSQNCCWSLHTFPCAPGWVHEQGNIDTCSVFNFCIIWNLIHEAPMDPCFPWLFLDVK